MAQIHDKLKELPDDVGEDFSKAESFHRMHDAFERDITALGKQVRSDETSQAWFCALFFACLLCSFTSFPLS